MPGATYHFQKIAPQLQATTDLLPVPMDLLILGISSNGSIRYEAFRDSFPT